MIIIVIIIYNLSCALIALSFINSKLTEIFVFLKLSVENIVYAILTLELPIK